MLIMNNNIQLKLESHKKVETAPVPHWTQWQLLSAFLPSILHCDFMNKYQSYYSESNTYSIITMVESTFSDYRWC